jgi:hypothetical protein
MWDTVRNAIQSTRPRVGLAPINIGVRGGRPRDQSPPYLLAGNDMAP